MSNPDIEKIIRQEQSETQDSEESQTGSDSLLVSPPPYLATEDVGLSHR